MLRSSQSHLADKALVACSMTSNKGHDRNGGHQLVFCSSRHIDAMNCPIMMMSGLVDNSIRGFIKTTCSTRILIENMHVVHK